MNKLKFAYNSLGAILSLSPISINLRIIKNYTNHLFINNYHSMFLH